MITIEEAIEIVKRDNEGRAVVVNYSDHGDYWVFGIVDPDRGDEFEMDSLPMVWKESGKLDVFICLPSGIDDYVPPSIPVPGREEYRERFNRVSMQETGEPYKFPDEWEE